MTLKQTDRVLIASFEQQAMQIFEEVGTDFRSLVQLVADVNYHGGNAISFKKHTIDYCIEFGAVTATNMENISLRISELATFIATNLGGDSITVHAPPIDITAPTVVDDGSVETLDGDPLRDLRASVGATCDGIEARFVQFKEAFRGLGDGGWVGPEQEEAAAEVDQMVDEAILSIQQGSSEISRRIDEQLDALRM